MSTLTIGLFGFGVVGEGIYTVLNAKPGLQAQVKKVCIKHPDKLRNAPATLFTDKADDLLEDPSIDVIVELIDDADAALLIVEKAMKKGKHVVSANKKMIAENLPALLQWQAQYGVSFLYEASVCGSIPVIRNLEEYFDNDLLRSFSGIVNGSTNYILTKMSQEGSSYELALKQAQELGFAESNPFLDVSGTDAANKLSIIAFHSFGVYQSPENIVKRGIDTLSAFDLNYAREKNKTVKLVAKTFRNEAGELVSYVVPSFVSSDERLFKVNNEFNGVLIESELSDQQFFMGKGAGRYPTSSAVLSDISALRYRYKYEYKKQAKELVSVENGDSMVNLYISYSGDTQLDESLFEETNARFSSPDRHYLLAKVQLNKLAQSDIWKDKEVSVIFLN